MLPGGIVFKLHIRPDSPLTLKEDSEKLYILLEKKVLSEFRFLPRPNFWNYTTSKGTPKKKLAQMYGLNSLNFNIYSGCEFWNVGKECRFCSVKSTVSGDNPIEVKKSPEELADVCELATKYDDINYIIVTGGSHLNQDEEFQAHLDVIKAIKDKLPWGGKIKGNISMMPPKDLKKLDELYINKVENPSFNMEAWPKYHAEVGSIIGNSLGRIDENYVLGLYRHASELYYKYDYKPFFDAGVLRNSLANEVYEGLL